MTFLQRKIARSLLIRGLALVGGFLIAKGVTDAPTWASLASNEEVITGLLAVIGLVWDAYATKKREVEVGEAAIQAPKDMTLEQVERSVPAAGFRLPSANR